MAAKIHPSAVVDPSAVIADGVEIGALAVIEAGVVIGEGSSIGHHAVVHSGVSMGKGNKIFPHAAVGGAPQDLKYAGQPTRLELGDHNMVREFTTLNRGTAEGGGLTKVGSHNLLMAYTHVAHDCVLGDHVVLANSVALGGHAEIGSFVVIGGLSGLHQYGRVGEGAMVGGMGRLSKDVLPFSTTSGTEEVKVFGMNKIGLRRRGVSKEDYQLLEHAFHVYCNPKVNAGEALKDLEALTQKNQYVDQLIAFIKSSQRGVYR